MKTSITFASDCSFNQCQNQILQVRLCEFAVHISTWTLSEECFSKDQRSRTPSCFLILSSASLSLAHSPKALLTLTSSSGPLVLIRRISGARPSSVLIMSILAWVADNSAMAPTTMQSRNIIMMSISKLPGEESNCLRMGVIHGGCWCHYDDYIKPKINFNTLLEFGLVLVPA